MNPVEVERAIQARHDVLNAKMKVWQRDAACLDPAVDKTPFTADRPKNSILAAKMEAPAKRVCMECPVRLLCLQHALEWPEITGIWGGLNFEERKPLMPRQVSVDGRFG